jgi:hypothetical protein
VQPGTGATFPVSGSLARSWTLSSGSDSVTLGGSLPAFASTPTVNAAQGGTWATQLLDGGGTNKASISAGGALKVDGSAVTQPISGSVSITGAVTQGNAGSAASAWYVQPGSGATFPVSGAFWQATQPVSLTSLPAFASTPTVNVGTMPSVAVTGTFWQSSQPVSLASLPALATGANTIGAVTQSGTWSTGRTWSLLSGSDSVTATISGTPTISGAVTANAGTNLNTSALALETGGNLAGINGKLTTSANGLKVDGSAVTQPVSGNVGVTAEIGAGATGSAVPAGAQYAGMNVSGNLTGITGTVNGLKVDGSAVTQPVSLASLPALATSANTIGKVDLLDGSGAAIGSTSGALNVQCANCSGSGVSTGDGATFTAGSSLFAGTGGIYQTLATTSPLMAGKQGLAQLTQYRALMTDWYNSSGAEMGTTLNPVVVSAPSWPLPTGAAIAALQPALNADGGALAHITNANANISSNATGSGSPVVPVLQTAGGLTKKILTGVNNSTQSVFSGSHQLMKVDCDNNNAAFTYLQQYDATSGVTVGTTPPNDFKPLAPSAGGGVMAPIVGAQYSTGLLVAATTTPTGGTAPATSTINCSFWYN